MIDPKKIEEWKALYAEAERNPLGSVLRLKAEMQMAFVASFPALLVEREEMLTVLREVEWSGERWLDYDFSRDACPACNGLKPGCLEDEYDRAKARENNAQEGHAPNCRLAALLGWERPE